MHALSRPEDRGDEAEDLDEAEGGAFHEVHRAQVFVCERSHLQPREHKDERSPANDPAPEHAKATGAFAPFVHHGEAEDLLAQGRSDEQQREKLDQGDGWPRECSAVFGTR